MMHLWRNAALVAACLLAVVADAGAQSEAPAEPAPPPVASTPAPAPVPGPDAQLPAPFASNLFLGNFARQQEDGINPEYVVMPGDRVVVNTWGTVAINDVFTVDGQGNIFLPQIGPVQLAGVRNADLTRVVKARIGRVFRRNFEVYTNLLTSAPVAVFVTGGVARPGRYAGRPSDSVLFYLDQAGGIDASLGSYRDITVMRAGKAIAEVDLYDFTLRGSMPAVQFAEGDTILVGRRGPVVHVAGAVSVPARIEFDEATPTGATAMDIVPPGPRATQVTVTGLRKRLPLVRTMSLVEFSRFALRAGDSIEFRDDGRAGTILVRLEGEFLGPSVLSVARGARLLDVLNFVPVDPGLADVSAVHLRRSSVASAQKKSIEDSLFRLERSALLGLSATSSEAQIRVREAELTSRFVERAKLIQPLGRVVTAEGRTQRNVLLREGDVIVVPPRTNVVRISGEVRFAHAVVFSQGRSAQYYIRQAGGFARRAETDKVVILHANAAVTIGDADAPVRPGDEILVLPRVDTKLLQNAADITEVLYQIAVSAGVVLAAF